MKHTTSGITSERVDGLPIILECLKDLSVSEHLDAALPRPHGDRQGLSYGQLSVLLLAFILTQQDHRLCAVEEWVSAHHHSLEMLTGWQIEEKDATDDRLGTLLELVGQQAECREHVEMKIGQQMIQAYELPTDVARCDSSSFSVYHQRKEGDEEESLLRFGHSKDHRGDLRQYRQMLGTIDPGGIPLVSETLAGNGADDSMYVPAWKRLSHVIGHTNFVFIADSKAGAQRTRAEIDQAGGFYCVPLAQTGQTPERLKRWVLHPPAAIEPLSLPTQSLDDEPMGQGFEIELGQLWTDPETQDAHHWVERQLVIQSSAYAQKQRASLQRRLEKAEAALQRLAAKPAKDRCKLNTQQATILKRYRVQELFLTTIVDKELIRYKGRGKPKADGASPKEVEIQFQLTVERNPAKIAEQQQLLGWRIYVTNAPSDALPRRQAMAYYRDQWQLERGYHRFKRGAIPAVPVFLQNEQRIVGLMFLMTVALRVLTLLEFRVRRELHQQQASLAGVYAGNPKRSTPRPSSELLLQAFDGITLYHFATGALEVTPLNSIQLKILDLLHIPKTIYEVPDDFRSPSAAA